MRYSFLAALAAPLLAAAAPMGKRQVTDTDVLVFTFADVLEQLESKFYSDAIAKFQDSDFTAAGFISAQVPKEQFAVIQSDEATHSTALQAALASFGKKPVTSCQFNFDSALTDVATMAATARVVENLGVAAYLGAAGLLSDPVLLTAAGSILTVEARHQTMLNVLSGGGMSIPQAFDIAFTPSEVLAVASPFISGCDLGVPANPTLAVTNTGTVGIGTKLTFSAKTLNDSTPDAHCQMLLGGAPFSIALPLADCVVPQGVNGPVALFITSDAQPLANNPRDRANNKIIAGPTMAFIDPTSQMIASLARKVNLAGNQASTTTATIDPAAASSVIASASSTASGAAAPASTVAPSSNNAAAGGPNMFTGPSTDGKLTVNGWTS